VPDLVLKTRVNVAQQNLSRLVNLQRMVDRRDEHVAAFLELPEELRSQVFELHKIVLKLKALDLPLEMPEELTDGLDLLESGLKDARRNLAKKAEDVRRVRDEFTELTRDRQDVDQNLVKAAKELGRTLTTANYWKRRQRCEALFSEYVDYLRGVAIRSTGFVVQDRHDLERGTAARQADPARAADREDDSVRLSDLFQLADHLPALWGRPGGWTWKSLAVPSRVEQNASTEAYVLRIGFPEWTIWALPLLQHEFGRVVIKKNSLALPVAGSTEAAMLADALAGLVTGPAYACAELLLRLDPASVNRWSDEVTLRSATILRTLWRSGMLADDAALTGLVARLEAEWRDAVRSAGGDASALDTALEKSSVRSMIERAAKFVDLGDWGGDQAQMPPWASHWATVVTWAGHLGSGSPNDIDTGAIEGQNGDLPIVLALLLDAAWLARVGPTAEQDAAPEKVDALATHAMARMLDAVRASRWESRPGGGKTAKE
jgi:hypothetical protein